MIRLILFFCIIPLQSFAAFKLSNNLNANDRSLIVKNLGLGTSSKNLTSVKPLGTEDGLEISFLVEVLDIHKISEFISSPTNNHSMYYPKFLIGKGLFESTDIFFHFIPYTESLGLSEAGGVLRYNVYRADDNFFFASLSAQANSANFNNQLVSRNVGGDLLLGLQWSQFSVFSAIGHVSSEGTFTGGPQGVTDSQTNQTASIQSLHLALGGQYTYSIFNFSFSYDRYAQQIFTFKVGLTL